MIDHVVYGSKGGVQDTTDHDPMLGGTMKSLNIDPVAKERALRHWGRTAMRCVVKEVLIKQGASIGEAEADDG